MEEDEEEERVAGAPADAAASGRGERCVGEGRASMRRWRRRSLTPGRCGSEVGASLDA